MGGLVLSVNVGRAGPRLARGGGVTGIGKQPVDSIELRAPGPKEDGLGSGVVGDFIGDRRNHGGDTQAVYAFAREELDRWGRELGRYLPSGVFGENLTTLDFDVDGALVGEHWRVGEALLAVTAPRIPCATFAGHMGERGWVKRFTQLGNTGAYLGVVEAGTVHPGDSVERVHTPDHDVDVRLVFRALTGDMRAARRVVEVGCLPPREHAGLVGRLGEARRGSEA